MAKLVILLCLVWGAGCKPANQLEPVPVVVAEPTTVCVSTGAGDESTIRSLLQRALERVLDTVGRFT